MCPSEIHFGCLIDLEKEMNSVESRESKHLDHRGKNGKHRVKKNK